MGVLYMVVPLSEEVHEWLQEENVSFPSLSARNPTPNELRQAIRGLSDIATQELGPWPSGDWQVSLQHATDPENGPWTLINACKVTDANLPCEIAFEKGSPELIVAILHALSVTTGPLVLIADTGEAPAVVWPGQTI